MLKTWLQQAPAYNEQLLLNHFTTILEYQYLTVLKFLIYHTNDLMISPFVGLRNRKKKKKELKK